MLWTTKKLTVLSLSSCELGLQAAESIGVGLSKNTSLQRLDISENKFPQDSFKKWPVDCKKGLRCLQYLDVSSNSRLGPDDIYNLLHCFKNQVNAMKPNGDPSAASSESSITTQPRLTELILKDTNMSKEAALFLKELLTSNTTLVKVNLDLNTNTPHNALSSIVKACQRNRAILKQKRIPKA